MNVDEFSMLGILNRMMASEPKDYEYTIHRLGRNSYMCRMKSRNGIFTLSVGRGTTKSQAMTDAWLKMGPVA